MGMDSSSAQLHHHHQEIMGSDQTLESMLACTKVPQHEKKPKPADEQAQKCPRCDSANTKFCYYNNYSLSQPRYFCKSCRRYWTKGGTLRNVPVGGGCRRNNKRPSSTSSSSSASSKIRISQDQPMITTFPNLPYDHNHHSNELGLAIARLQRQSGNAQFGLDNLDFAMSLNPNMPLSHDGLFGLQNNVYYGMENGGMGRAYEEISTDVKQEMWGLPSWQNAGGQNGYMAESDSNRVNWNGVNGSSTWHGLLNSPLM